MKTITKASYKTRRHLIIRTDKITCVRYNTIPTTKIVANYNKLPNEINKNT